MIRISKQGERCLQLIEREWMNGNIPRSKLRKDYLMILGFEVGERGKEIINFSNRRGFGKDKSNLDYRKLPSSPRVGKHKII